jgi:hypothetical protein
MLGFNEGDCSRFLGSQDVDRVASVAERDGFAAEHPS